MSAPGIKGNKAAAAQLAAFKEGLAAAAASTQKPAGMTVREGIERWLRLHSIGNKPRSVDFNKDIARLLGERWSNLETPVEQVTEAECLAFAESVAHYCPSRYNAAVNAARSFIPAAAFLPRKPMPPAGSLQQHPHARRV